jgi:hypothetical protein
VDIRILLRFHGEGTLLSGKQGLVMAGAAFLCRSSNIAVMNCVIRDISMGGDLV